MKQRNTHTHTHSSQREDEAADEAVADALAGSVAEERAETEADAVGGDAGRGGAQRVDAVPVEHDAEPVLAVAQHVHRPVEQHLGRRTLLGDALKVGVRQPHRLAVHQVAVDHLRVASRRTVAVPSRSIPFACVSFG